MARYVDVHPVDPQPRAIAQAVQLIRDGGPGEAKPVQAAAR